MTLIEAELVYQPKVRNNKLVSIEALLRPKNCTDIEGFIKSYKSPIVLDSKVLELVYSDLIDLNLDYPVSINVSYFSLIDDSFIYKAISLFRGFNITLELTEYFEIKKFGQLKKNIEKLQRNKISVALDNFGRCISKATLLTLIDFDEVKIDKSIINNIDKDFNCYKRLSFLSGKIRNLGTNNIVYKGIERFSQFELIELFDKNAILQGYYYTKPLKLQRLIDNNYMLEQVKYRETNVNKFTKIEKLIYEMIISENKKIINNKVKYIDDLGLVYNEDYNKTIENFSRLICGVNEYIV